MDQPLSVVVTSIVLTFLMKVTALILGYLTIRLGYQLIEGGAKGEFKFAGEFLGLKADLASLTPGLLFVLLGTFLIGYGISVDKLTEYEQEGSATEAPPAVPVPGLRDSLIIDRDSSLR